MKKIRLIGLLASILGLGAQLLMNWNQEKQLDEMIEKKLSDRAKTKES